MRLLFCGVRGSVPVSGAEFTEVGGHTSCVAVSRSGEEAPCLVLDAGTGLLNLTAALAGDAFRGSILLSHLHWDHLWGIPFFVAGDRPDAEVAVMVPEEPGRGDATALLGSVMGPPWFPIGPDGLKGRWSFTTLPAGHHRVEGFDVHAAEVPHKGGRTLGFRVDDGRSSFAYIPDHLTSPKPNPAALELARDVDVLVHDAQFLAHERTTATAFGHATLEDVTCLAEQARVGRLVLFHHAPSRTDIEVTAIVDGLDGSAVPTIAATEGLVLDLSRE